MSLRLGSALTLVVSSPDMAKEFLKTHDLLFASRPPSAATNYFWYNCTDIGFAPYGAYWRQVRKVCVLQLLSSRRLDYFRFIREEEVSAMIHSIADSDHPDMLGAGTDTSSTTIEWAMSELLRNPPLLKKVQDELERVVGMERMVLESDLPSLPYLQAVLRETLRLYPSAPLALPHLSVEACNVLGYEIPKNTQVLVNLWAIGRNPTSWEDAERFVPERFMNGCSLDEKVRNCEWIPFGAGRRVCPGEQLGMLLVQFPLAQLLHCFDWTLPDKMNGQELDMSERSGITVRRVHDLYAVPTPRLTVVL